MTGLVGSAGSSWEERDETETGLAGWWDGIIGETFCGRGFLRTAAVGVGTGVDKAGSKAGGVAMGEEVERGGLGQLFGGLLGGLTVAADEPPVGGGDVDAAIG